MSLLELDPITAAILGIWFLVLGACIGSFLNVVVYRLPLRKSLSDPPSHCPRCGHAIRRRDNVPVFGWLVLRGRCRDCKEPISVRYPLVEAASGLVFGVVAFLLLGRGGDASLPEFCCLTTALSVYLVTLLAAGLIEKDGQPVPGRLFLPAALAGPMVPWLWQDSFRIALFDAPDAVRGLTVTPVLLAVLVASVAALPFFPFWKRDRLPLLFASALAGLYLGRAAGPAIIPAFAIFLSARFLLPESRVRPFLCIGIAVFACVLFVLPDWRSIIP